MNICDIPVVQGVCVGIDYSWQSAVVAPFLAIADGIGAAAEWMFVGLWTVFEETTLVDVTSDRYVSVYNILFGIAVFVLMIFFLLQLITGMMRRDPTALSTALLGLARAVLGSFLVITLTGTALEIVDQLCIGIIQAGGTTVQEMGASITLLIGGLAFLAPASPAAATVLVIFLGGLALASAAIVWMSLLIRKALLLVAIVLAPLALSGTVWDHTKGWASKWLSFVVALILSKLIVVVIFLIAVRQVSAPIDFDLGFGAIADPLSGVVLMGLAGFAPYLAFKFISFIGFDLYQTMSAEQEAKSALNRPFPFLTPQADAKKVLDAGAASNSSQPPAGGGAPSAATVGPSAASGAQAGVASGGSAPAGATASSGTAASASSAGASAAGPVVAGTLLVAEGVRQTATAGPRAGASVAQAAERPSDPPPAPRPAASRSRP